MKRCRRMTMTRKTFDLIWDQLTAFVCTICVGYFVHFVCFTWIKMHLGIAVIVICIHFTLITLKTDTFNITAESVKIPQKKLLDVPSPMGNIRSTCATFERVSFCATVTSAESLQHVAGIFCGACRSLFVYFLCNESQLGKLERELVWMSLLGSSARATRFRMQQQHPVHRWRWTRSVGVFGKVPGCTVCWMKDGDCEKFVRKMGKFGVMCCKCRMLVGK